MSKPPVIVFGDFTLDEATRFQQLNLGPRPEINRTPDQHQGDGPPPVRFGSVDPTVHISHSPPALPQPAPALPPYPHHPPPYLTANHHPPFLQSLPPPHFAPPRSYYPPAPYYNSFGTFPHPGGGPLPFNPDYLYARPILPPHPYHGPVDPSQTLGLSSAPLAVMPPLSRAWRPHPLASPPPAQPDRAPHPPPGVPEFPPGPPPPWAPPSLHLPAAGAPFHHERPHSSGGGHVPVTTVESAPSGEEPLVSSGKAESRDAEDSAVPPEGEPAHADGRERTHEEAENATAADPPRSQSQEPALIPGHASGGGPAEPAEVEAAPTGWGPEPSSANEANVLSESPAEATEDAAPAGSGGEQVSTSEAEQQPGLGAARPKSWAALVGKQAGQGFVPQRPVAASSSRTVYNGPGTQPRGVIGSKGGEKPQLSGPAWIRLLKEAPPVRLRPRGLMNTGNSCFLNSTLQALFACPPFLLLVNQLRTSPIDPNEYPMLWALVNYLAQFDVLPPSPALAPARPGPTGGSPLVDLGLPFSPDMFVDVLNRFSPNNQHRGLRRARQEDAQEFLSYVMDRMHEELLKLEMSPTEAPPARAGNGPLANGAAGGAGEGDDEWETVGPKNKSAVTRMHTHSESALSSIFGGSLQSLVKTKGTKASATVQPFTIVQLDISAEAVKSVEDALQQFAAPETLDGYRTKGKTEVAASKLLKIQTLPRVLVLHLMRFSFSGERGSTKVHKPVKFPPTLTIPVKLLASPPAPGEIRRYELVATVSHIGKDPSGGHYTADARQEDGRWLRFDDSNVSVVPLNRVLHDQAYLLLYKRVVQ